MDGWEVRSEGAGEKEGEGREMRGQKGRGEGNGKDRAKPGKESDISKENVLSTCWGLAALWTAVPGTSVAQPSSYWHWLPA